MGRGGSRLGSLMPFLRRSQPNDRHSWEIHIPGMEQSLQPPGPAPPWLTVYEGGDRATGSVLAQWGGMTRLRVAARTGLVHGASDAPVRVWDHGRIPSFEISEATQVTFF